ncbi:MAG: nucleotidyl transferase AbiEii/AbiGii toxin family protein [Verrucomicrobiota bacterium]|nr:nucleotidyl transferase AbiEii/AbiGii toxin family protein [Verrucomicrobiota bacterium]
MKTIQQLKALVRKKAHTDKLTFEIVLREYMFERFLERVAASAYREQLILKGGLLVSSLVGIRLRTTMDADVSLTGLTLSRQILEDMMTEILAIPFDDAMLFSLNGIDPIQTEAVYPGVRVSVTASQERMRQILKIDIATGDVITPGAVDYEFPLMFENRTLRLKAYPIETILAEKAETLLSRGTVNSRMRDFYDMHILSTSKHVDRRIFRTALLKTMQRRNTSHLFEHRDPILRQVSASAELTDYWRRYRLKNPFASNLTWTDITNSIHTLFSLLG